MPPALPPELETIVSSENPFFRSSQPYAPSPISIPGMGPQASATLWMMLEPMLQRMMPGSMMPGMLLSNRNLFSQMRLRRDLEAQQAAQTSASAIDQSRMFEQLRGLAAVMGTGFDPEAGRLAVSDMGPLMRMMAGVAPDMYEAGLGWRGSAEIMARNTWMASRYMRDPVTGANRMTGESLGVLNQEFYDRFYGLRARPEDAQGISAGRAGALLNELVGRGYGPPGLSRQQLLTSIGDAPGGDPRSEDRLRRLAAGLAPDASDVDGRAPNLAEAQTRIRRRAAELSPDASDTGGLASNLTEALTRLGRVADNPALDQALRSFNGQRVADFFGRFNRTFGAVQDLLADIGVNNATPGQMLATLNALTQSSINSSTPEALTMRVARAQAMSSYGISLATVLQSNQYAGSLTDQLGLRRSLAPALGDAGILYARAGYLNTFAGVPGSMDPEQAGAYFVGRAAEAASSNVAGQVAAIVQMGRYAESDGTAHPNMRAYMEAVRARRTTFTMTDPSGARVTRSIYFRDEGEASEFVRSSGGDVRLFQTVRQDSNGLQAIINEERIGETAMRMGYNEDIRADVERIFSAEVGETLPGMRDRIGVLAGEAMGDIRSGTVGGATQEVIDHVFAGLRADGVTLSPTQQRELRDRLRAAYADFGVSSETAGYIPRNMTREQFLQAVSVSAAAEADTASRTVDARAAMTVAVSGLGSGTVLSRLVSLLERGPGSMEASEAVSRILGGVSDSEAAGRIQPMITHLAERRREAEAHIAAGRFTEANEIIREIQPMVNDLSTMASGMGLESLEPTVLAEMRRLERRQATPLPLRMIGDAVGGVAGRLGLSSDTLPNLTESLGLSSEGLATGMGLTVPPGGSPTDAIARWATGVMTTPPPTPPPTRVTGEFSLEGTITSPLMGILEAKLRALSLL